MSENSGESAAATVQLELLFLPVAAVRVKVVQDMMASSRRRQCVITAVILVFVRIEASRSADTTCREFSQSQISQIGAAVQEVLQSEQKSFAMPSAAVALFDCRGLVWTGATGFADKDQHVPAGADTVFRTGRLAGKLTARVPAETVAYAEMQSYDAPRVPAPASQPPGTSNTTLRDMASLGTRMLATPKRALVSNTSAVSGFVSKLSLMPDAGIGVVAYAALDRSSAAARIADYALQAALAVRDGKQPPGNPTSRPLNAAEALPLVGEYRHQGATVEIRWMNGAAFIETPRLAGRLQRKPSGYVMDDYTVPLSLEIDSGGGWLEADGIRFIRHSHNEPAPPAPELAGLIGDYGGDSESIRVFERDGSLFLRTGGVMYDSMARVTADVWKFPRTSPSHPGRQVKFSRDTEGRGTSFEWNGVSFPRRNIIIDPPAGKLSEEDRTRLRQRAMAGEPPRESESHEAADLVSIASIDHAIKLDVHYATSQNLLGFPVYSKSAAYLQRPAAEALARADQKLHARGFGIVVFDAYRPWFVTKMFWDGTPEAAHVFVADPSQGSRHNRGAAVDISLIELASGREVTMTGAYDEFSPRSYPLYDGGTAQQRWRRDVLREALESENFTVYAFEWWHFDFADWRRYGLLNIEFAQLPP